jgi:glycosidase
MLIAQDPPQYGTPFAGVPDPRDASIYQVNMRAFSSTHNFQGVINRLDQIKALGVNVIYLMPVYPVGVLKSVNSPYCIRSFDSVGTEFGSLTDLRTLVDGAHSRGMGVILDFVVNQTSWDHPWINQHPDWYLHDGSGNIEQLGSYTDVAALNFSSTAMCSALVTAMRGWVFRANVDGFRCDFADNPPIGFWQQTIANLRGITTHKLLMLAEGTRSGNYGAGFDYNFGMQFYFTTLKDIYSSGAVTEVDNSNTVEYAGATGTNQIVRYLTNHDVDGSDGSPVTLFGGKAGNLAAFVVIAYMKGVPFVYNGTEVAFPTAITFPFTSVVIDWTQNPDQTAAYTRIITFRNSSNAIRRGTLVSYDNNDVAAFTKTADSETVAVFSNLRNSTINYALPAALQNTTWKDAFTGAAVTLGTSLSLSAYQYQVLTKTGTAPPPPPTSFTVYFYKPASWGNGINIYWWDAQPAGVLADGTWPGVAMTNDNNGWYSYTFTNVTSTNLIFNDGSNQTANLSRGTNGWYQNGVWYDSNPGTTGGTTYYEILNRWQANTYLHDGGNGEVLYGTSPGGTNYQWAQVSAGNGYVYLQNRGTGNYMHVENQTGYVQCGAIQTSWYSAMWGIDDAGSGAGWDYVENRWQANQWVHIEDLLGHAEYANAQAGWWSAMWQFVNPVTVSNTAGSLQSGAGEGLSRDSIAAAVGLYPNPARGGLFYITVPQELVSGPVWVSITDVAGRTVYVTNLNESGSVGHSFAAGVYFVRIRTGKVDVTKKLVVE